MKNRGRSITLALATVLGQAVAFLMLGVLTRIYSSQDFAVYGMFAALCSVYGTVSALKLDQCIVAHHHESERIVPAAVVLTIVTAAGFTGVFALLSINLPAGGSRFLLVLTGGVSLLLFGFVQLGYSLRIRDQQFGQLSAERFAQISSTPIQQAVSGSVPPISTNFPGLILGEALSRACILASLWISLKKYCSFAGIRYGIRSLASVIESRRGFTVVLTSAALVGALGSQLPMLVFPLFHSSEEVGQYYLWWRLVNAPLAAVAAGFSSVFFSDMARSTEATRQRIFMRTTWSTVGLSAAFFVCLALIPSKWFGVFLGVEWADAKGFVSPIVLASTLWVPASATSSALVLAERQRETLWFSCVEVVLKAIAIVQLRDYDLICTVYAVALISLCLQSITIMRCSAAIGAPFLRTLFPLSAALLVSLTSIFIF